MGCELICDNCPLGTKKACGMWRLDAFENPQKTGQVATVLHTHTRERLHARLDARTFSQGSGGTLAGGYGGIPSAIEINPDLYTTDNLKAEEASKK